MNKERFFIYLPRVFILVGLLFSISILKAADQCLPSDFSATLTPQSPTYSNSGSISRGGSDTYYFSVSSAGTVTVTITSQRNNILFSYSDSICPNSGDSPASASATYTFATASDFNLRVYRAGRGGGRRGGSYTINVSFTPSAPVTVRAEYRMDECGWNGTPGEALDSSGGGYDATAVNGANTLDAAQAGGGLCRVGDMRGKYLKVESPYPVLGNVWSMSLWLKFPLTPSAGQFTLGGYEYYIMATVAGRGDLGYFAKRGSSYKWGVYDNSGRIREVSIGSVSDGWHHVVQVVTGGLTYLYIDGSYIDKVNTYTSGDLLYVGSSTDSTNSETIGSLIDEFKIFDTALTSTQISSIYSNELNGSNYDGTARVCKSCTLPLNKSTLFNAVDYAPVCNAALNWEDNITTKVAGSGFDLSILAKDADTNLPMEANITRVDLYLYASGDTSGCSGTPYAVTNICTNGCGTTGAAGCLALRVPTSLNSKASRCVQVHIEGRDINSTLLDVNESNSSDNFALRPELIEFLSPAADANLTAQELYYYAGGLKAVMADGTTAAADYNTTVSIQGVKVMRTGEANSSLAGTLTAQPLNFGNGVADINFSFSDVARLSLRIEDSSWASVDADDTPLESRVVAGERNVTFIPSHFDLQFVSAPFIEDNDTTNRMTYISNDLNMSAWVRRLSVVVTAKGERGSTLLNFSNPMNRLFADPVDISVLLNLPVKSSTANTLFEPQSQTGADINFTSGEAVIAYADVPFNYDRSYSAPVAPFFLAGSEGNFSVAVTDASYRDVNGTIFSLFDGNATFYYGRVRAEDVATTELSTSGRVYFEVYDPAASPFVAGFTRSSLEWYINKKHDKQSQGKVVQAIVKEGTLLGSATDSDISVAIGSYLPGSVDLQLSSSVAARKSRVVHLDIDEWLWYAPHGFGSPYDFSASSDCISHPCFIYTLTPKGAPRGGVLSGEFGGSDFNTSTLDANATFDQKTGVKLFR